MTLVFRKDIFDDDVKHMIWVTTVDKLCFQVDDIDIDDEKLRKLFHVKKQLPPSLKVLTVDGTFQLAFVVGDNKILKCHSKDLFDAMLCLLATYYVMDLDYPAMYGQLLGFLQQFVMEEPYTFFKGTNFIKMSRKFACEASN